jgi:hypothetical protein
MNAYKFKTTTTEGYASRTTVGFDPETNIVHIMQRAIVSSPDSIDKVIRELPILGAFYIERAFGVKLSTLSEINNIVIALINENKNQQNNGKFKNNNTV